MLRTVTYVSSFLRGRLEGWRGRNEGREEFQRLFSSLPMFLRNTSGRVFSSSRQYAVNTVFIGGREGGEASMLTSCLERLLLTKDTCD